MEPRRKQRELFIREDWRMEKKSLTGVGGKERTILVITNRILGKKKIHLGCSQGGGGEN